MNQFFILLLAGVLFTGCDKNQPGKSPETKMKYVDLHQSEVKMGSVQRVDLNEDGSIDFNFKAESFGDPILKQERLSFMAKAEINGYLLAIENTETTKRLDKGNLISQIPPSGFGWFGVGQAVLTEKVTSESNEVNWQGDWNDGSHHYLPVQIVKNGSKYCGWIELSMDVANEKMILHQGAISTEAGKDAKAGY